MTSVCLGLSLGGRRSPLVMAATTEKYFIWADAHHRHADQPQPSSPVSQNSLSNPVPTPKRREAPHCGGLQFQSIPWNIQQTLCPRATKLTSKNAMEPQHETTAIGYEATRQLCLGTWTRSSKNHKSCMRRPLWCLCTGGRPGAGKPTEQGAATSRPSPAGNLSHGQSSPTAPPGSGPGLSIAAASSKSLHPEASPPRPLSSPIGRLRKLRRDPDLVS